MTTCGATRTSSARSRSRSSSRQLPAAAAATSRAAVEAGDHARWYQLVRAIGEAKLELPKRAWCFPLVERIGGRAWIDASALGDRAWTSHEPNAIVTLLAASGEPVLHAAIADQLKLRAIVEEVAGCELVPVHTTLTRVALEPLQDADEVLVAKLAELLALAYRAPSRIAIARFEGAHADVLALAGHADRGDDYLVHSDDAGRNPFGRKRLPLVLSASHPTYVAARGADPRLGAALLARILLLQHRLLDVARSTTLLEHALDEIDAGGRS